MKTTTYAGIDYGHGITNVSNAGFHYGVISQNSVLQAWADSSGPFYGEPDGNCFECSECGQENYAAEKLGLKWGDSINCANEDCGCSIELELPDCAEPISHYIDDSEYSAECGEMGEIVITKSPYFMHAQFCSPCFPGAGNCDTECEDGPKTLCFGHDWFEDGKAPYRVYNVSTGLEVFPK